MSREAKEGRFHQSMASLLLLKQIFSLNVRTAYRYSPASFISNGSNILRLPILFIHLLFFRVGKGGSTWFIFFRIGFNSSIDIFRQSSLCLWLILDRFYSWLLLMEIVVTMTAARWCSTGPPSHSTPVNRRTLALVLMFPYQWKWFWVMATSEYGKCGNEEGSRMNRDDFQMEHRGAGLGTNGLMLSCWAAELLTQIIGFLQHQQFGEWEIWMQ